MSSISSLGSAANAFLLQAQYSSGITGAASGSSGAAGNPVSAIISEPGQLFSELQQLQAQDPAKLKQIASQIANQLQAAAQQPGSSGQASFLNKLAGEFQNVANGGDASQLKPHHHHAHHGHHTYNSNGQAVQSSSSSSPTSGTSIQDIFATITNEVAQALSGS